MNRVLAILCLILGALALLALPFLALGAAWGPRAACPVGQLAVAQVPALHWQTYPENPGQAFLLDGQGRTLGGWDFAGQWYRAFDGQRFRATTSTPPIPPPSGPGAHPPGPGGRITQNFGLQLDKMGPVASPSYARKGVTVDRETAWSAVAAGGKLQDDRDKPWLLVIGSEADRKKYLDAFEHEVEPELRARLRVCSLAPEDYRLRDTSTNELLYVTTGTPTVYCQAPDGKVLHRQDEFKGDGKDFQAIRKAIGYEAKRDRDMRAEAGGGLLVWLVIGGAIFWLLSRSPKEQP